MPDLTPQQIASVDCGYWATLKCIQLQAAKFSFSGHEYQIEPMSSTARRRCYMKGTQGGWTEIEVLRSLHAMIHGHHPQGDLYMFPTTDDVQEFSKSRFNPLISANKQAIGRFVKSSGKGTDTASLKKIGDAFLYLRGARLSQKISDVNESSKMKGIPVDSVKFDEVDHMDLDVIAKARGRMGHSKVKEEVYLSNPIVPGEGIDKIFATSDQRYWHRLCTCGAWTCAEKFFIEDPERCVGQRADGSGFIRCHKCEKEVPIWSGTGTGMWIPDLPSNSDYMHGYQHSQLTSNYNDPWEILTSFRNPPEGNVADVYRTNLGLPYIAAEDRLTKADVFNCCNNTGMYSSHKGPCAMGVDVGKIKHVVIGAKIGNDQYQILKVARVKEWYEIHDLARRFNVKSDVIDIRPYEDSAREYQKNSGHKTFLCEYKENTPMGTVYNDNTGIVAVNRTEIFDKTHRLVTTPGMFTIPRVCPEMQEFAKQLCGAYKVLETNKRNNSAVYRYKGKNEHYRNALNYFMLAASGGKIANASRAKNRPKFAKNSLRK